MGTDHAASVIRKINVEALVGLAPTGCVTRQPGKPWLISNPPSYFGNLKFARWTLPSANLIASCRHVPAYVDWVFHT